MIILSVFNGPFGPYGHGSFLPIAETTSRYFMSLLTKMSEERISAWEPSLRLKQLWTTLPGIAAHSCPKPHGQHLVALGSNRSAAST